VQILRSDEGRELRARHQENVRYLREKLLEAGLPVIHTPSHIIPLHVCIIVLTAHIGCIVNDTIQYVRFINSVRSI